MTIKHFVDIRCGDIVHRREKPVYHLDTKEYNTRELNDFIEVSCYSVDKGVLGTIRIKKEYVILTDFYKDKDGNLIEDVIVNDPKIVEMLNNKE